MKTKSIEEAQYYQKKILGMVPLASRILTVAVKGDSGTDWAAYIGIIESSHEREAPNVAREGTKLPSEIAKILFPGIASTYNWRP